MITIPYSADSFSGIALDVNVANWQGYGSWQQEDQVYPKVCARLSHTGHTLDIMFDVEDWGVQAQFLEDQSPVWQESCVELFIAPIKSDGAYSKAEGYYNFEWNALGTCLAAFGPNRNSRQALSKEALQGIKRVPSLGHIPREYVDARQSWQLSVKIALETFEHHDISTFFGQHFKLNLYKCGDNLPRPHYLSWQAISTLEPDFHRPEYFRQIQCATYKE
jgi:hypothetical protein